jgi:hypothetical protein
MFGIIWVLVWFLGISMFFTTSNTHSCTEAVHDVPLPKIPNMLMSPAGVLSYLVNIRKKEGLTTVGNTTNMSY